MGRPREHDQKTRLALLEEAERLVAAAGPDALSVRSVAEAVGSTTWAVYSVFGSKDGLVVALAQRAFEILETGLRRLPETDDPAADLIDVGLKIFRVFVRKHPSLYRIAFQRIVPGLPATQELIDARERVFSMLIARLQRLDDAGLLAHSSAGEAAVEFNAMCEGLANAELRGTVLSILPAGEEERAWRNALATVIEGFKSSSRGRGRRSVGGGRRGKEA